MKKIGLQVPPSGLPCYIHWNNEKITLDEYDDIWISFQYKIPINFRGEEFIVKELIETVPDIQNIKLTGVMQKL